jgi:hypothetical protein
VAVAALALACVCLFGCGEPFAPTSFEVPTTTPNPQLAGLGDGAFLDVPGMRLLVLSGREIASISIHGSTVSATDALPIEEALAAVIVGRLLH